MPGSPLKRRLSGSEYSVNGKKRLQCHYCDKTLASPWGLDAHIKTVHGTKCFNCDFCPKAFARRDHLDNHVKSIHTGLKTCGQCRESFKGRDGLQRHVAKFHPELSSLPKQPGTFVCHLCPNNKSFINKYRLKQHCLNTHGVILPNTPRSPAKKLDSAAASPGLKSAFHRSAKCPLCRETVSSPSKLAKHMNAKHRGKNVTIIYKCEFCSGSFSQEIHLTRHIQGFHAESTCLLCGNIFVGNEILGQHIKESHLAKKVSLGSGPSTVIVFQCESCGMSFPEKNNYYDHVAKSHTWSRKPSKDYIPHSEDDTSSNTSERILHECEICDRLFVNENHLDEHLQEVHPYREMHSCEICEATFDDEGSLDEHIGEYHQPPSDLEDDEPVKPLSPQQAPNVLNLDKEFEKIFNHCDLCDRYFDDSESLKIHLKSGSHSDDELFKCLECTDVIYTSAVQLERHLSLIHPIENDESEGTLRVFFQCNSCEELHENQELLDNHSCPSNTTSNGLNQSSFINNNEKNILDMKLKLKNNLESPNTQITNCSIIQQ